MDQKYGAIKTDNALWNHFQRPRQYKNLNISMSRFILDLHRKSQASARRRIDMASNIMQFTKYILKKCEASIVLEAWRLLSKHLVDPKQKSSKIWAHRASKIKEFIYMEGKTRKERKAHPAKETLKELRQIWTKQLRLDKIKSGKLKK